MKQIGYNQRMKKEFIYWWVCPSGNQYYIHGDYLMEARDAASKNDEVTNSDYFFINERIPQSKFCRACVKDKKWPPYQNEFLKVAKEK